MFDLLTGAQWDSLRNWLATLGGLVALLIATNTYRRNVRTKREEQARLIYSKLMHIETVGTGGTFELLPNDARMGTGSSAVRIVPNPVRNAKSKSIGLALAPLLHVTVIVHNGSKELIGPARVQMVNVGLGRVWDEFSISIGAIDPETDHVVQFTWINDSGGIPGLGTTVIFRDASGQWWRRHLSEPIERVHDDPENNGATPTERIAIRAFQQATGVPEDNLVSEPRPSRRVQWHRFWRARRGLTRLP